jgi:hypothetical protein
MKLYLDTTNGRLVTSATDATPLGSLPVHQGDIGSVQLVLLAETGNIAAPFTVIDLPTPYASITLGARLASNLMQEELLFSATGWVASGTGPTRVYTASLNRETSGLADAFPDANLTLRSVDALLDIQWTSADESEKATPLRQWPVTITRDLVRDTEGVPTSGSPLRRAVWMPDIVGLTGGGATKLDGLTTAGVLDADALVIVEVGGVLGVWQLTETEEAEPSDTSTQVVPDDFADPANQVVWRKVSLGASTGDALTDNPLSQFAATTSAELRSVISDPTGTGAVVFANGNIGDASAYSLSTGSLDLYGQTITATAPTTLPIASYAITFAGLTAPRTVTLPDGDFSAARTDAVAQTFSGSVTFNGGDFTVGASELISIATGGTVDVGAHEIFITAGAGIALSADGGFTYNGQNVLTEANGDRLVVLSGSVANSTTSLADVTGLSCALDVGTWSVRAVVVYSAALTTTGGRFVLNGPAASLIAIQSVMSSGAAANTVINAAAYDTGATAVNSASTTANIAIVEAVLVITSAGTVIVRFASETAGSAITARPGSHLRYRKLS